MSTYFEQMKLPDLGTRIVVEKDMHGFKITCGLWSSGPLSWDEAIGTFAALLVPLRTMKRVGHMVPSMENIRQDLRYSSIIEYFGE